MAGESTLKVKRVFVEGEVVWMEADAGVTESSWEEINVMLYKVI